MKQLQQQLRHIKILETQEDIDGTLAISGMDLAFNDFNIQAIYAYTNVALFQGAHIINGTESQDYKFYTDITIAATYNIITGMKFTIQDRAYLYTFSVTSKPVTQIDGWSVFNADLLSSENV